MKVSPGSPLNTNYVITRLSKKLPPGEAERGGTGGEGKVKAWGGGNFGHGFLHGSLGRSLFFRQTPRCRN